MRPRPAVILTNGTVLGFATSSNLALQNTTKAFSSLKMQGASGLLVAVPRNRTFLTSPGVEVVQQDSTAGEEEGGAPADPGPADTDTAAAAEPAAAAAAEPAAAGSKPPTKAASAAGRGRRGAAAAEKQ
jgi:hypothetical protein